MNTPKNPCTQDCPWRKVGCKSDCVFYFLHQAAVEEEMAAKAKRVQSFVDYIEVKKQVSKKIISRKRDRRTAKVFYK